MHHLIIWGSKKLLSSGFEITQCNLNPSAGPWDFYFKFLCHKVRLCDCSTLRLPLGVVLLIPLDCSRGNYFRYQLRLLYIIIWLCNITCPSLLSCRSIGVRLERDFSFRWRAYYFQMIVTSHGLVIHARLALSKPALEVIAIPKSHFACVEMESGRERWLITDSATDVCTHQCSLIAFSRRIASSSWCKTRANTDK